ncbi:hypothetical protein MLD38_001308 [Melastoma candidum]|uniref:Uncharacterized protein n=1 Tax=Melastoma candidum TaxID=119954 RepID=A0ACB9SGS6_9MYRT|nr:hypothetical protein MLD38_001308 [Melastoma candidum]
MVTSLFLSTAADTEFQSHGRRKRDRTTVGIQPKERRVRLLYPHTTVWLLPVTLPDTSPPELVVHPSIGFVGRYFENSPLLDTQAL